MNVLLLHIAYQTEYDRDINYKWCVAQYKSQEDLDASLLTEQSPNPFPREKKVFRSQYMVTLEKETPYIDVLEWKSCSFENAKKIKGGESDFMLIPSLLS